MPTLQLFLDVCFTIQDLQVIQIENKPDFRDSLAPFVKDLMSWLSGNYFLTY